MDWLARRFSVTNYGQRKLRRYSTYAIIANAYKELTAEVTDDAAAVERLGYEVKLYRGDYNNIKVTTPEDLALAEIIAADI